MPIDAGNDGWNWSIREGIRPLHITVEYLDQRAFE
jgi:hypothetical protein